MGARTHDLASLLHPIALQEFFANYWERGPLLVQRRGEDYYQELLSNRDLEDIISSSDARYPAIRLAKGGRYFAADTYTKNVQIGFLRFQGVPDVDRISEEYAKGATITLPALHRTWEPLRTLCAGLEEQLDHSIHANAYLTPGEVSGFPAHYDTHDILVLQLAGRKRWRIDEPTIKLPHDSQMCNPEGFTAGPRLMEVELAAGDLLYLPRGYTHSTTTSECHSAHVTIGINIYSWVDVIGELVPGCAGNEEFRKGLPVGFASRAELRPAMQQHLARLLPALSAADHERLLERLIQLVMGGRQRIPVRFRADAIAISPDSLLKAPGVQYYDVAQRPDRVTLHFEGKRYNFQPHMAPLLGAMCERTAFRIRDLVGAGDIEQWLSFARYLQRIGFLRAAARAL